MADLSIDCVLVVLLEGTASTHLGRALHDRALIATIRTVRSAVAETSTAALHLERRSVGWIESKQEGMIVPSCEHCREDPWCSQQQTHCRCLWKEPGADYSQDDREYQQHHGQGCSVCWAARIA
jgi:hypothetical protein